MEYDSVLIFVSFGWFMSVTVIFLMYVRMRQMSDELKAVKYSVEISDEEMKGLERSINEFRRSDI